MRIPGLPKRSGNTAVLRIAALVTLLQGVASAQTNPTLYTSCTISGEVQGFFGGYVVSGSYSGVAGGVPTVSNIILNGAGSSGYVYDFTGLLNGNGYTVASQLPVTPCDLEGCTGPLPAVYATLHVATFGTAATLVFNDGVEPFNGSGTVSCSTGPGTTPPPPPNCGPFNVVTSGNGTQNMFARYTPTGNIPLQAAAAACNYIGFNWQQQINILPCPSPVTAQSTAIAQSTTPIGPDVNFNNTCQANGADAAHMQTPNAVTAPPSFSDPPPGGYTYIPGYNPYPFYYPSQPNALVPNQPNVLGDGKDHNPLDPANPLGPHLPGVNNSGMFLAMSDSPADPCLTGGLLDFVAETALFNQRVRLCGWPNNILTPGLLAPPGSAVGFSTSLVGLIDANTPSAPLFPFTWVTTFNGTAGGVAGLSNAGPADPGSGTGYITITSINGVAVPPIVPVSDITTTASGLAYSRVTKTFDGIVTITNISGMTLTTPTSFQLALNSLTAGVTLVNSTGTFNQGPYITIPALISLAPTQSLTVAVQFSNPSNATINFTPEFYAGSFQ